jgi:Ala-tRNA(Pro) deacylase
LNEQNQEQSQNKSLQIRQAEPRARVYDLFCQLNIPFETAEHPPLFSQADTERFPIGMEATIFKNLFLRNKNKSRYYLYSLPIDKRANLTGLQKLLEETRLSFGDEAVLEEKLHIKKGSVSLLNIVDAGATDVVFLIDCEALQCEKVGFHPNDNRATILFSPRYIQTILDHFSTEFHFVRIDE